MVKLFSVGEMVTLEKEANNSGLTYSDMMENAGKGVAQEINNAYSHIDNHKIFGLIGPGNNGGDTLVALSHLEDYGWDVSAYIVRERETNDPHMKRLFEHHGTILHLENDKDYKELKQLLDTSSILIDGILGTGIKLPIKGEIRKLLSYVKGYIEKTRIRIQVVAVDCPSGVDCDSGEVAEEVIPADITVTMGGIKQGLIKFPAAKLTGDVRLASIGEINQFKTYQENKKLIITDELVKQYLPKRPIDSHKGTFGTAFIIAGSVNFTGAALLSGSAAYRIGAGLVTMAIPEQIHSAVAGRLLEATWVLLPDEMGVISSEAAQVVYDNLNRATAVLIGPGFGVEDTTKDFLRRFITFTGETKRGRIGFIREDKDSSEKSKLNIPLIIDADGLKLLSKIDNWSQLLPKNSILTPHPGEMSVITGLTAQEIQDQRIEVAMRYAADWGQVIVLKGAFTIIASPEGNIGIVPVASSALARAGTGDVLAGLIVGLRAQGVDAFEAACAGAWIHAQAGLLAAKHLGNTASVIAGDVLGAVPEIITELQ